MDILLISPHTEFPADTSGRTYLLRSKEYMLNTGLLSIASFLETEGINSKIIDLTGSRNPKRSIIQALEKNKPRFVGISNLSAYNYLPTIEYVKLIRKFSPNAKIIVGGLHAGGVPKDLLRCCPEINFVVIGEGEIVVADLIKGTSSSRYKKRKHSENQYIIYDQDFPNLDELPPLNYKLYPRAKSFVPYVEESRGCNFNCNFCVAPYTHKRKIRIKNPEKVAAEIFSVKKFYNDKNFHMFIEANNFALDHRKTERLCQLLSGSGIKWRTESRIDTFPIHLLDKLVDAGLRVLDIGIESGSPEMLLRMNKTRNPKEYLERCVTLAKAIKKNGKCLLKLNIVLYYGENSKTIKETRKFLRKINNISPIAIALGPVRMDPGTRIFIEDRKKIDLKKFHGSFWDKVKCYPVDLSNEISFEQANKICAQIAREFQTSKNYYQSKRYSQLPYRMSYKEFMKQSKDIPPEDKQWKDK